MAKGNKKRSTKVFNAVFLFVAALALSAASGPGASGGPAPREMVLIPAGEFWFGSSQEEIDEVKKVFGSSRLYATYRFDQEKPKRKVSLNSFYIDRHEVTNEQYARFVEATGHKPPRHWVDGHYRKDHGQYPVLYVSYNDAAAYAKWAGKRLPTEEEWEKASRGTDGRVFPWGNEFDPYKTAVADSDMRYISGGICQAMSANKIEIAEGDTSPFGVRDMAGNIREWTSSSDPKDPAMKIVKGASWVDRYINARAAHREFIYKDYISHIVGFRCAMDAAE